MNKEIAIVEKDVRAVSRKVGDLEIKTQDDLRAATDVLSQVKTAQKSLKAEKEKILGPQLDAVQATRNLFAPFEAQLNDAEFSIKRKMIAYEDEESSKARIEEAKIQAKLDAGRMKPETAAKKIEQIETVAPQVSGNKGVVQFRTVRKVVIDHPELLPREYLMPDEQKIKKAALAGISVAGTKVVEEKIIAAR